tara:strand:+ start:731 stop:1027 length:297 start_codon:yes stop_codon:yes gene_type:complete
MAITKTEEIAQIEIVQTCIIQVALNVTYKEDGKETNKIRKRYSLIPCGHTRPSNSTPSDWVWNDTDVSDQPQQVQDICNTVWTDKVKADYKAKIIAQG